MAPRLGRHDRDGHGSPDGSARAARPVPVVAGVHARFEARRRDTPQRPDRVASGVTAEAVRALGHVDRAPRATWRALCEPHGWGTAMRKPRVSPPPTGRLRRGWHDVSWTAWTGLSREIVAEGGADAPRRICQACLAVLPVNRAAVTVMTGADRQEPIWASDEVARHLDETAVQPGRGSLRGGVHRPAARCWCRPGRARRHRWPVFAAAARRTPVQALFVLPRAGRRDHHRRARPVPGRPRECWQPDELAARCGPPTHCCGRCSGLRDGTDRGRQSTGNGRNGEVDPHGWLSGSPLHHTAGLPGDGNDHRPSWR